MILAQSAIIVASCYFKEALTAKVFRFALANVSGAVGADDDAARAFNPRPAVPINAQDRRRLGTAIFGLPEQAPIFAILVRTRPDEQ